MSAETFTPDNVNELVRAILNIAEKQKQIAEMVNFVNQMRAPIIEIKGQLHDSDVKLFPEKRNEIEKTLRELDEEFPWRDTGAISA